MWSIGGPIKKKCLQVKLHYFSHTVDRSDNVANTTPRSPLTSSADEVRYSEVSWGGSSRARPAKCRENNNPLRSFCFAQCVPVCSDLKMVLVAHTLHSSVQTQE